MSRWSLSRSGNPLLPGLFSGQRFRQGRIRTLLLILCIALFLCPTMTIAQTSSRAFPMPASEAVALLKRVLESGDLTVNRTELDGGKSRLSAAGKEESWKILVSPHSALGTRIEVELYDGPGDVSGKLQSLWDDIVRYQQKPEELETPQDQSIPSPVLARIASVVCIRAVIGDHHLQFSGFLIDSEGLILSTAHDLKVFEEVKVVFSTGLEFNGDIIHIDHHRDLALIKINATHESVISPAQGRNLLGMGETIYSIGCPISLRGTIYAGHINGPPRRTENLPLWQVDMQIMPGSSGSPVFDAEGAFTAMVKGRYRGTDRIGFLIPLETILAFLEDTKSL